jgi:hypothetical protein
MADIAPIFTFPVYSNRRIAFQLRITGTQNNWDVSGASSITLGWEPHGGTPGTPLVANQSDPYANWANGLVVFWIGPTNITANVVTVDCALVIVTSDGQTIPVVVGPIEIIYQPGTVAV